MAKWVARTFGAPFLHNNISGYMTLIGGQPVDVQAGSLSIERSVGMRASASFVVRTVSTIHFEQYQQVRVYDKNNILAFSGYITNPKERFPGKALYHTINCCDQHYLADKRRFTGTFENKTCGYIVQQLVNEVLAEEGVTVGQIYDGLTPGPTLYPSPTLYPGGNVGIIPKAVFSDARVSDIMDALVKQASASGVPYFWMIDEFKRLWFVPYTALINDEIVDGTRIDDIFNPPTVSRQNPSYRNIQIVTGGVQETVTQNESRKGDGETTAWSMSYPLARVPTVTVDMVAKTVGIKGVETGKDFYWNKGDPLISQDSAGVKLTSSNTLRVTYIGQYPSKTIAEDSGQVAYQRSVDGTSGKVEEVNSDSTLDSLESALSRVNQLLARYATQGTILEFSTLDSSFLPGQLRTVDLPMHGINSEQMLVVSVTASDQTDGINIWHRVKVVQGPYDNTWVQFFGELIKQQQGVQASDVNVGVNQIVVVLQTFTASISVSMDMEASIYACPVPSVSTIPSTSLIPC